MASKPSPGVARDEVALVASARAGDRAALGALLERHRPRLYAAALSMLGSRAEAEDAVHDAFTAAILRLGELRDGAAVGPWLLAVVRSRCLMELRRRRATPAAELVEDRCGAGRKESLDEHLERSVLRDWLWTAIGRLPEAQRLTVMLRYFGSYGSYSELAATLGIPVGTVRSRISDAKRTLAGLAVEGAASRDPVHRDLAEKRQGFFSQAFRDLFGRGRRDEFLSHFSHDLQIVWSSGKIARGRTLLAAEIDDDLEAGVRFVPRRVLASGNLTVVEGVFENPPEDPQHCPPGAAMVFVGDGRWLSRLHLHLAPRSPREDFP